MELVNDCLPLPPEIWKRVFQCRAVSHTDLLCLSAVSKDFKSYSRSSHVWRQKFLQNFNGTFVHMVDVALSADWMDLYKLRYICCQVVKTHLDNLSARFVCNDKLHLDYEILTRIEVPDFKDAEASFTKWWNTFLIEELRSIIVPDDQSLLTKRLTDRFYAKRVLGVLVHKNMISVWEKWDTESLDLEEGFFYYAQWFQPELNLRKQDLCQFLDAAAEMTKCKISLNYKNHPCLKESALCHASYTTVERSQLIRALNHVFTVDLGLRGNAEDFSNLQNSYWNKIIELKKGIPISMCIMYLCIARRLGIECVPLNNPGHFLIKVLEDINNVDDWTVIDVFNGCILRSTLQMNYQVAESANSIDVILRMCNNVLHMDSHGTNQTIARELMWIIQKTSENMLQLIRNYLDYTINLQLVRDMLYIESSAYFSDPDFEDHLIIHRRMLEEAEQHIANCLEEPVSNKPPNIKTRQEQNVKVKWIVGMIMKHKKYDYKCVIFGWDPFCDMSQGWKLQMGVSKLGRGEYQPFYNVLANDGSVRYAAEDNLMAIGNKQMDNEINHPLVGKYFEEFCGSHYVMNKHKAAYYPNDLDLLRSTFS